MSVELSLSPGATLADVSPAVLQITQQELQGMESFVQRVCHGEFHVC